MIAPLKVCFRTVCCSMYSTADRNMVKQAQLLQRMLDKHTAKKKSKPHFTGLSSKGNILSAYDEDKSTKRMTAVNKIYMENLMPMLTSGTYGSQLSELEIEIPRVSVNKRLDYLNIYWITRNPNIPTSVIESVLQKALKELQLQMGTLRYIPKIPFLRFVRDERLEKAVQLERIFDIADYGEGYEPIHSRRVINPTNPPNKETKMRLNLLSLDYESIKGKIMARLFRHKAININGAFDMKNEPAHEVPEKLIPFNRKDFYKFYNRRRILAAKLLKRGFYDE